MIFPFVVGSDSVEAVASAMGSADLGRQSTRVYSPPHKNESLQSVMGGLIFLFFSLAFLHNTSGPRRSWLDKLFPLGNCQVSAAA